MTEQDKQLLLKDLCARLPYGVIVDVSRVEEWKQLTLTPFILSNYYDCIEKIKPYLRFSMTDEEQQEYYDLTHQEEDDVWAKCLFDKMVDFCNERHLDYRGLIEKGLALEAPKDMYKTE